MARKQRRSDRAQSVAFNPQAPVAESQAALGELQQQFMPTPSAMLHEDTISSIMDVAEQFHKSADVLPFPGDEKRLKQKRGMRSVELDEFTVNVQSGDYWDRPGIMQPEGLRAMADQVSLLNAIIWTRARQVQRFCGVQEDSDGLGFCIKHMDRDHAATKDEQESIKLLNRFFLHCGWEMNPRMRKKLKRDSFSQCMAKLVRDTLTMDAAAIETEFKRDMAQGMDGFYAVDGATIRLCPDGGYQGDEDIFAVQVIQGRVRTAYNYNQLIFEPRNPRSDVTASGYGFGETELLVRVVTGFLNAMTFNSKGFDANSIPKGMLHITGNYDEATLAMFKRQWNAMVRGVNNAWVLPVMVSKDQESKASFERFGIDFSEMAFAKWMTFLASIACAIYGMSPSEINFDSFTGGNTSALSGSDTAEKLAESKDKGLRPLLSYFENLFTDYITSDFSDKYAFRWQGLDPRDRAEKQEQDKLVLTWNEMRAIAGYEAIKDDMGDIPLNPSLIGPWMQSKQAQQPQDFGTPPQQQGQGEGKDDGDEGGNEPQEGNTADDPPSEDENKQQKLDFGDEQGKSKGEDFGKALALSESRIYSLDW